MAERRRIEVERWSGRTQVAERGTWPPREPDAYSQLRRLAAERAQLDARIRVSVQELRQAGASWTVVGEALGVTRSAAQKRYGADELPLS